MLASFTVKNYRSFRQEQIFSMEAASSVGEHHEAVITKGQYRLLPLTVFYGANSGGKSNLVRAIATMRSMVIRSVRLNEGDELPYDPFALDEDSGAQPTFFEIEFLHEEVRYRYGFEYNATEIISEWLYERRGGEEERELFLRSQDQIEVALENFPEGKGKEDLTNSNRLFLSLVAQLKGETANVLMRCFGTCNILSGIDTEDYEGFTLHIFLKHLEGAEEAQEFFKTLQLGFTHFSVKPVDVSREVLDNAPEAIRSQLEKDLSGRVIESITTHSVYNENGAVVGERNFHKDRMESEGTKKVIELSGPIFDTLRDGKTLIVDELDAKLHPLLTRNIVLLFMDSGRNKHGAQLIFTTHDTNLLDLDIVRRDQIWFAEKDKVESTDIYSLVEFEEENEGNGHNLKRDYIQGRYGAIPFIGK